MKRESSWGLAAIVAVAASIGIAVQPWSQGAGSAGQTANRTSISGEQRASDSDSFSDACSGLAGMIADFFVTDRNTIGGPEICYKSAPQLPPTKIGESSDIKFIIATVPDPIHTHLALIFDRFTEAIQHAAQD